MNFKLIDVFRMEYDYSWDMESWFLPLALALQGLNSKEASWQPPGGGNTIWQTVNHLNYYNDLLVKQINGISIEQRTLSNTATFGEPGDPKDDNKWDAAVSETHRIAENLRQALAQVDDSNLEKEHIGGLARQIMHNVYHTGQIVLIRKQQGSWPKERE